MTSATALAPVLGSGARTCERRWHRRSEGEGRSPTQNPTDNSNKCQLTSDVQPRVATESFYFAELARMIGDSQSSYKAALTTSTRTEIAGGISLRISPRLNQEPLYFDDQSEGDSASDDVYGHNCDERSDTLEDLSVARISDSRQVVLCPPVRGATAGWVHGEDSQMPLCGALSRADPTSSNTLTRKRHLYTEDSDDEIVYLGETRRIRQRRSASSRSENGEGTPLNPVRACGNCGCTCEGGGGVESSGTRRSRGSGSTTLSSRVLGNILTLLLGGKESLFSRLCRTHSNVSTWADIAELVGARREDFDRVRHAAAFMQNTLPGRKYRGEI